MVGIKITLLTLNDTNGKLRYYNVPVPVVPGPTPTPEMYSAM